MKIRSDSVLAKLTEEQLGQIVAWLASGDTYRDVQKRCALPPPEGFGLSVQLNTLWNFYTSERRRRHTLELAQNNLEPHVNPDDSDRLLQNAKSELAHACYDLARHPDAPSVNILARITCRIDAISLQQQRVAAEQRRIAIEEQRVALERECLAEKKRQFNFNAAREAAKHAAKIHKVIETKGPDNEDKIWMVNNIVFGPPPATSDNSPSTPQNQNSLNH